MQTLNLVPYRVDLTPFAGLFSNGKPHTVGVRVFNNANFFQVAGALLVYRDPVLQKVRGDLLRNTLTANPSPVVQSALNGKDGQVRGPVSVTSRRRFTIAGYVVTSAGKVVTTLTQTADFSSDQQFTAGPQRDLQNVRQASTLSSTAQTQMPKSVIVRQDKFTYPLALTTRRRTNPDGTVTQTASVEQGFLRLAPDQPQRPYYCLPADLRHRLPVQHAHFRCVRQAGEAQPAEYADLRRNRPARLVHADPDRRQWRADKSNRQPPPK